MLLDPEELARVKDDPVLMLQVAGAFAKELRYTEASKWYRAYLRRFPEDLAARQMLRDLKSTRAVQKRWRHFYEFADKCNLRLKLEDRTLSDSLQRLYRTLGQGEQREAEIWAHRVQQQLEASIRQRWQLDEAADLWGEVAHWASVQGFYDFAIELLERSPRHDQEIELDEAIQMGSGLLECAGSNSRQDREESTDRLRQAILKRDLGELQQAIESVAEWIFDEDLGDFDPPLAGVPRRPRPPTLDAWASRELGEWPQN